MQKYTNHNCLYLIKLYDISFMKLLAVGTGVQFLMPKISRQVAAVVFTEDLKRLYVTMKEGFPLEYIVRF